MPHTCQYLKEDAMHSGHKVLMEVDDNSVLIVADPQGTLGLLLMPHTTHLLSIIIVLITY